MVEIIQVKSGAYSARADEARNGPKSSRDTKMRGAKHTQLGGGRRACHAPLDLAYDCFEGGRSKRRAKTNSGMKKKQNNTIYADMRIWSVVSVDYMLSYCTLGGRGDGGCSFVASLKSVGH